MSNTRRQNHILRDRRTATHLSHLARLGGHIAAIFVVALSGSLAAGYFVANYLTKDELTMSGLVASGFILPLVVVAAAITLGLAGLILFIDTRSTKSETPSGTPDDPRSGTRQRAVEIEPAPYEKRRMITLSRSAEQLSIVERDLLRKINDSYELDITTHKMIRDMQRCTNRLMAQIFEVTPEIRHEDLASYDEPVVHRQATRFS